MTGQILSIYRIMKMCTCMAPLMEFIPCSCQRILTESCSHILVIYGFNLTHQKNRQYVRVTRPMKHDRVWISHLLLFVI